jgi:hypothetical protein
MTISWMDGSKPMSCIAHSFNTSTYGLMTEAWESIPVGTKATVQLHGSDETVEANVRHCRKMGAWYRIGLELTAVLPKAAPAAARKAII